MARIAAFAFDISEAAQIRRIHSLQALGHDVASLSFRRENMNAGFQPDWPDVPLGVTRNESFLRRFVQLGLGLVRAWRGREGLEGSDVWIARNFDLLVIAAILRRLMGRRDVQLVYECLDIHGLFTRADMVGRAMRWAERRALAGTDLLIVSSPGFLTQYFEPIQGYRGASTLIENKLWLGTQPISRPKQRGAPSEPLVLGWVGSLRCAVSLEILAGVARSLGDAVQISLNGNVHRHAVPEFDRILSDHPNIHYAGPYQYPDDLAAIYGACDLVWAQDLWQQGANSDWLLPNRIYEASYFGCPSIAVSGSQTGLKVREDGLGFVVDAPDAPSLIALLKRLTRDEIGAAGQRLLDRPEGDFRLTQEALAKALEPVLGGGVHDAQRAA
ncbi:MAG: glycosyltransferase [Pseudomonadota bacterium]